MKKIVRQSLLRIFFLLLFFYSGIFCNAQKFNAGIVFGALSSDVGGLDMRDGDLDFNKAGLTGGAFISSKISEKSSWQFEILYTQKGTYQPPDSLNFTSYYKVKLDYVEVPVLFRHKFTFNINKNPIDRFGWEFGPTIAVLAKIKTEGLSYSNGTFISVLTSDKGNFNRFDYLLNAGLFYQISDNFSLNIRYSNSVVPAIKRELFNQFFFYNWYKGDNMSYSFTIRYTFTTKKEE